MTPAIVKCYVDESSDYPTHRPLCIEVITKMLEFNVRELRRPTNFANLLEQQISEEIDDESKKRDEQIFNGNDAYTGPSEHDIRKNVMDKFHAIIDDQLERREHSLKYAAKVKDTGMQWDLVAAAVEAAAIKHFKLDNKKPNK